MTTPQPFMGLPDLGKIVDQVTGLLPDEVADAIKSVTEKIIDPDNDEINEGDPQPEGEQPIPVEGEELNKAVKVIDTVMGALDVVLKFSFVLPDDFEELVKKVQGALRTIRGWLD
jgi:hypothetical protein